MNKKQHKIQKAVYSAQGRKELIARLQKLAAKLEDPELTVEELKDVRAKVEELQAQLTKVISKAKA